MKNDKFFSSLSLSQGLGKNADIKSEKILLVSILWIWRVTRTKKIGLEVSLVHFLGFRYTESV